MLGKLRPKMVLSIALALLGIIGGAYLLLVVATPQIDAVLPSPNWNHPVAYPAKNQRLKENRIYLPKLKLNLTYKPGEASVLSNHVWHRSPERGDPAKGGNFILAGHRFELGLTPGETRRKSPFYRLDQIVVGDKLYVDFAGIRYEYTVVKRFVVKPNDISIEAPSKTAKMTLYSCTLGGTWDGRDVVEAKLSRAQVNPSQRF